MRRKEISKDDAIMSSGVYAGPSLSEDEKRRRRINGEQKARAALWSAVWELSQFVDFNEIRNVVEGTIREVQSDEP